MQDTDSTIAELGNEPPLVADGRSGPPDRREVSARWLTGTFLTGLTSTVLMGVALVVALDGREQLAVPPEIADLSLVQNSAGGGEQAKAERLVPIRQIARARNKQRVEISMKTRVGDRDVVRTVPFMRLKMPLAAGYKTTRPYPPFDPLDMFAEDGITAPASPTTAAQIYGSKVESEMTLKVEDFPIETAAYDEGNDLSAREIEEVVRNAAAGLSDGAIHVAAMHYVDPQRFGDSLAGQAFTAAYDIRIVQENVTETPRRLPSESEEAIAADVIAFTESKDIVKALAEAGYGDPGAEAIARAAAERLGGSTLRAGAVLSVELVVQGENAKVIRLGVYDRAKHVLTLAFDDRGAIVQSPEPDPNPAIFTAFDDTPFLPQRGPLPTVYDGVYQAAYAHGMSRSMTRQLIRLLAADVDLQSRLSPTDQIQVFFSQPDESGQMSEESELLHVAATFGNTTRNLYRFLQEDGTVDYFDAEGRNARQFLIRKPVPNGMLRSGFGGRRHPILGVSRMHTGVDWAAPRGTPILAAGNGVVEKAGWAGGYGRQTIIRHANGYETSYNHQSAFAQGIKPGVRVRQGQVIGYVGNTGLSTGPHLHYEVIVNDRKVDPLRVRLPSGKSLKGEELERFQIERARIDELLKQGNQNGTLKVASVSG